MRRVKIGSNFKALFMLGVKIRSCVAQGKWKISYFCLSPSNQKMEMCVCVCVRVCVCMCVCVVFFLISS